MSALSPPVLTEMLYSILKQYQDEHTVLARVPQGLLLADSGGAHVLVSVKSATVSA